ncbi:MAG: hypothetical protein ACT4QF_19990 [Sporichthyaceae bacterium]
MSGSRRLPRTLFGGRVRTSTVLLATTFVGVLLLWYGVRPDPAEFTEEVVRVRTTRISGEEAERRKAEAVLRPPAEVREPVAPTPVPTKSATPRPKRTPVETPTAPAPTPPASGEPDPAPLLPGEPAPEPVPSDSASPAQTRRPGLLGDISGARAPELRRPSTTPADTTAPADAETPAAER